ncbi:MAG: hypothetical protein EPN37_11230 [Chitinophagaceae bacterium]|nr:MAG: hypothetical protein EPN37_11230 [Chitinophagaceae bacterium]
MSPRWINSSVSDHIASPEFISSFSKGFFHSGIFYLVNRKTMGIEELVLERAKKEGLEKGKLEGKIEEVKNLLIKMAMTDAQAADIAGVPVDFVKKVRRKIKK